MSEMCEIVRDKAFIHNMKIVQSWIDTNITVPLDGVYSTIAFGFLLPAARCLLWLKSINALPLFVLLSFVSGRCRLFRIKNGTGRTFVANAAHSANTTVSIWCRSQKECLSHTYQKLQPQP